MREMKIDRGLFQITMSQQHLDGAQVGTGLQQMRCKTMPQRVRMNVLVLQASTFSSSLTRGPEHLGGDRMTRRMPSLPGNNQSDGLLLSPRQ
jgi:hypothetical protein